ncbi:MAG TPA: hypothetical protein VLG37_04490 [Candidatus Saccharimonadales bacterium]|nr:hypothetical protein [Candidatus Saccharimonadales bacterium]
MTETRIHHDRRQRIKREAINATLAAISIAYVVEAGLEAKSGHLDNAVAFGLTGGIAYSILYFGDRNRDRWLQEFRPSESTSIQPNDISLPQAAVKVD